MQNLVRPFLRRLAEFELRRAAREIEMQYARRGVHRLQIFEHDLDALIAAEENVVCLQVRLAGQRTFPVMHAALEFLSHCLGLDLYRLAELLTQVTQIAL